MKNLTPIIAVIIMSGITVIGDYFMKLAGTGPRYVDFPRFLIGMVVYLLSGVGWFFVMKYIKLSTLGVYFSLTTIILLALVGVFFFKERLTPYEIVGIGLGVISIFILARFN